MSNTKPPAHRASPLRGDLARTVTTHYVEWRVIPSYPGAGGWDDKVVIVVADSGANTLQDYLTLDQAEELANALTEGVRQARLLATEMNRSAPPAPPAGDHADAR